MSAAVEAWVVAVLAGLAGGARGCEADGGDDCPEECGSCAVSLSVGVNVLMASIPLVCVEAV